MRILSRLHGIAMILALTVSAAARAEAAASLPAVERATESAVRVEVSLDWPGQPGSADFSGSGWTRECNPADDGWDVVVSTAGHVVDIPELENEARPAEHIPSNVKVVVIYRDGLRLIGGRENLFVDRVHDYGEVHVRCPVPRTVLPVLPARVRAAMGEGARIFTVASPGSLQFGCFVGNVISPDAVLIASAPQGAWLCSIAVAPGASGAPVVDDDGCAVATVIGLVIWPWGGQAAVVAALPPMLCPLTTTLQDNRQVEDTFMDFLSGLIPFVQLGALGAGASILYRLLPAASRPASVGEIVDVVYKIASRAVLAVEQAQGQLAGADKKQLAEQMVGAILSHFGIKAAPALIDAAIESAVMLANALADPAAPAAENVGGAAA